MVQYSTVLCFCQVDQSHAYSMYVTPPYVALSVAGYHDSLILSALLNQNDFTRLQHWKKTPPPPLPSSLCAFNETKESTQRVPTRVPDDARADLVMTEVHLTRRSVPDEDPERTLLLWLEERGFFDVLALRADIGFKVVSSCCRVVVLRLEKNIYMSQRGICQVEMDSIWNDINRFRTFRYDIVFF